MYDTKVCRGGNPVPSEDYRPSSLASDDLFGERWQEAEAEGCANGWRVVDGKRGHVEWHESFER